MCFINTDFYGQDDRNRYSFSSIFVENRSIKTYMLAREHQGIYPVVVDSVVYTTHLFYSLYYIT